MTAGSQQLETTSSCVSKHLGSRRIVMKLQGNSPPKQSDRITVSIVELAQESFTDLSEEVVNRLREKEHHIRELDVQSVDVKALLARIDRFLQPQVLQKCLTHPDPVQRAFMCKVADKFMQLRPGVHSLVEKELKGAPQDESQSEITT